MAETGTQTPNLSRIELDVKRRMIILENSEHCTYLYINPSAEDVVGSVKLTTTTEDTKGRKINIDHDRDGNFIGIEIIW